MAECFVKFHVTSVDPRLRPGYKDGCKLLSNQDVYCGKVEDFIAKMPSPIGNVAFIVGVHNHGPIIDLYCHLVALGLRVIVIALPCCTDDAKLPWVATKIYDDPDIVSPRRKLYLWDSHPTAA